MLLEKQQWMSVIA